jgi:hypothetical protein
MKRTLLLLTSLSLVGIPVLHAAGGPQTSKPRRTSSAAADAPPTQAAPAKPATGKKQMARAEFVAYDASAKTITVKDANGQTSSTPVEGKAMAEVAHLKKGDKVMLTWRDSATGEHQAVTAIRAAKGKG